MMGPAHSRDWVLLILSQQRSGTTALRRTLAQGSYVQDFGEVFHAQQGDNPHNYFNFKGRRVTEDRQLVLPSADHQAQLWNEYLDYLRRAKEKPFTTLDVKYNSWHHFDPVWHLSDEAPGLVSLVRKDQCPVIHVVRHNVFAQACSAMLAQRRGVFHLEVDGGTTPPSERIGLNPVTLARMMKVSIRYTGRFRELFADHNPYVEVEYESLFEGPYLSSRAYAVLREATGQDIDEGIDVPLARTTPNLADLLSNGDELREYFQGTEFKALVEQSLSRDAPGSASEESARQATRGPA
jgi:LPS sulfotransferase NodH